MEIEDNLGDFLRKMRKKRGIKNQKEFSKLTGISQATISRLEAGTQKPTFETLSAISKVLNISIQEFTPYIEVGTNREENEELVIKKNVTSKKKLIKEHYRQTLNLDDYDTIKKFDFAINGESLTLEEYQGMIAFVHSLRYLNKKK